MKKIQWENRGSKALAYWLRNTRTILETFEHTAPGRFKFSHIPAEGISKLENIKKSQMGVEPGVPDFIVVIPKEISIDGEAFLLVIELKEKSDITGKASPATKDQLQWLEILGEIPRIDTMLCTGYNSALTFILDHLSVPVKWRLHREWQIEIIENRGWVQKLLQDIKL